MENKAQYEKKGLGSVTLPRLTDTGTSNLSPVALGLWLLQ